MNEEEKEQKESFSSRLSRGLEKAPGYTGIGATIAGPWGAAGGAALDLSSYLLQGMSEEEKEQYEREQAEKAGMRESRRDLAAIEAQKAKDARIMALREAVTRYSGMRGKV